MPPYSPKKIPAEDLLGEEMLRVIGLLFVVAGSVELALALQFARLIAHPNKIDSATAAALGQIELRPQLQRIKIIARFRLDPEKARELIRLCDRIQDSFDRRNELAHWMIAPAENGAVLRTFKIKTSDGSLVPAKPYTAQQIREFAETLYERLAEFDRLLTASGIRKLNERDFIQPEAVPSTRTARARPGEE